MNTLDSLFYYANKLLMEEEVVTLSIKRHFSVAWEEPILNSKEAVMQKDVDSFQLQLMLVKQMQLRKVLQ